MLEKMEKLPDIEHGPSPMRGRSYVRDDVIAFVDSDMDCARIHFEGRSLVAVMHGIRNFLKKNPELSDKVFVTKRKDELYLVRK